MSRVKTSTPLPELERELHAAARRLDAAAVPSRRRRWRHSWTLLGVILAAAGGGVAIARVVEVGPFAYLARGMVGENPKLAATSTITLQPGGDAAPWQARAYLNGLDQLCLTGGPRDNRPDPYATPTRHHLNNPPSADTLCADSDEIAQDLVDPKFPGASVALSTALDGTLGPIIGRTDRRTGRIISPKRTPARHVLVFAIRVAGATAPVVRWYSRSGAPGTTTTLQPAAQHLRMDVDHSPEGLTRAEQETVATYPAQLDLVLWAASVPAPRGAMLPQVASTWEFPLPGVDDNTIEMIGGQDIAQLVTAGKRAGWKYNRGIRRREAPVSRINTAQSKWIAAFDRPRTSSDAVPKRFRTLITDTMRVGLGASRKLDVVGGGLGQMWIAPGGMPEETLRTERQRDDVICLLGSPLIDQCKFQQRRWTRPFVEEVTCTEGARYPKPLPGGGTLVWALTPPGAKRVELDDLAGGVRTLPAGDLLAVRRSQEERIETIVWIDGAGKRTSVRVPWPKKAPRCGPPRRPGQVTRKDNAGSYSTT